MGGETIRPQGAKHEERDLDLDDELQYLDSGGEHAVYTMLPAEWSDHVAKVNYVSMRELLDQYAQKGGKINTITPRWRTHHENEVRRREKEYRELRHYFGYHVPEQYTQIAMVPLTNEQIRLLYKPNEKPPVGYETVTELPAVLTIQEKVLFKESTHSTSFHFGSIDIDSLTLDDIHHLAENFTFETRENIDYLPEIKRLYPPLQPIIDLIDRDLSYKKSIRDFVESLIRYTSETGKGLDLVGKDNVVFYGSEGVSDYKLLDVIQLEPKLFLKEAYLFNQWLMGEKSDTNIADVVPDNIHFLRAINALAWLVGSNERLKTIEGQDILPHVKQVANFLAQKIN